MNHPDLLHYRFVSVRLRQDPMDRQIRKQAALVKALQDKAIQEMRRLKLMLARKGGAA